MPFVTKLRFQSGDRDALEGVVTDLKRMLERKGAECKGPHSSQPERMALPLSARCQPGADIDTWDYTVYRREMEIHGADQVAGEVGHMDFPDSVHLEIEVDRKTPAGRD